MKLVTFTRDYSIDIDASTRLNYPAGWSGHVEDDVANGAAEAGALEVEASAKPVKGGKASAGTGSEAPPA